MRLRVGERFPGSGPAQQPGGYVVTEVIHETPWQGLYAGKKIFYNFDFTSKRPRETEEKEWLSVFLRTIQYPHPDDPNYVAGRRTLAHAEAARVLGHGTSNLWPEPVDVLEVPNTQDPFSFRETGTTTKAFGLEPILIFARPSGELLADWQKTNPGVGSVLGVLAELLDFLRSAEQDGVVLNGLSPQSVLVDPVDRVHYLATDMVLDSAIANGSRKFFPAERYAVGFTPPEYYDVGFRPNSRGDLYSWGCIAFHLLSGDDPAEIAAGQHRPWTKFQDAHFDKLENSLRTVPEAYLQTWAEQLEVSGADLVRQWPANALSVMRRLLSRSPHARPANVRQLKDWLITPPALLAMPEIEAPREADVAVGLPPAEAAARLWESVLADGDSVAHRQLLDVVVDLPIAVNPLPNGAQPSLHPYVASLEKYLGSRPSTSVLPRLELENVLHCLREANLEQRFAAPLVESEDDRVREIGREVIVGLLRARLDSSSPEPADVRRELETVCPADVLEEKLQICRRLAEAGVHATAVHGCYLDLQEDRPTACSECSARVRIRDLETHLRQAHEVFQFRGARRSFHDTRALLLDAVCGAVPDLAAWKTLDAVARERHAEEAEARVVSWISQKLRVLERDPRHTAMRSLAEAIVGTGSHGGLLVLLCKRMKSEGLEVMSRQLALEILALLPPPVSDEVFAAVRPMLPDKRLGRDPRVRAVASLLKTTGPDGDRATELLLSYIAGNGKLRAIDKLREVEQRVGPMPAIESLCTKLEDQLRMTCPRCSIELPRVQMTKHLWDNHRLVLDGRRVREPWRLMEDWIEDYRLEKDITILARCRHLAERLDGDEGAARLERLLLQHGIEDADALARLQLQARNNSATLCPHCYDLVALPSTSRPTVLQEGDDRLDAGSYALEISDSGLVPWIAIEGPQGVIYEGRQVGRLLTRNGFLIFLVGPLVLTSFVLLEWLTDSRLPGLVTIGLAIGLGIFVTGLAYFFWPSPPTPRDQLVDLAWVHLVPRLHARGFDDAESALIGGLALFSVGYGKVEDRTAPVETLREYTEAGVRKHEDCLPHLAALWRLSAEDARDAGEDPVPVLVTQLARCFTAKQPLRYAGALLARSRRPTEETAKPLSGWSKGELARLRVLTCERAFQDGLEPQDLVDLATCETVLQETMHLENLAEVSELFLLWKLRGERPWDRLGESRTVFELAQGPDSTNVLNDYPDLLWIVSGSAPLHVCGRGVFFENARLTFVPTSIEVIARRIVGDAGYDLIIGPHTFHFNYEPDRLAKRLEAWLRYLYRDFLPQVTAGSARRSRDILRKLHTRNRLTCPECRRHFLPRLGDVGLPAEENERR